MPGQQATKRKLDDVLIVDVDAHHYENECMDEFLPFMENDVLRQLVMASRAKGRGSVIPSSPLVSRTWAGASRAIRCARRRRPKRAPAASSRRAAWPSLDGRHERRLFMPVPDPDAGRGLHPDVEMEVELCWAYNRWLTEKALPDADGRFYSMLSCRSPIRTRRCGRSKRSAIASTCPASW